MSFNSEGETTIENIKNCLASNRQEVIIVDDDNGKLTGFVCVQLKKSFCYNDFRPDVAEVYKNSCDRLINDAVVSEEVTTRIFENVIEIIRNEDKTFETLIEQISTKGGTTEAGISKLKNSNLSEIINQCIDSAYDRVNALKKN